MRWFGLALLVSAGCAQSGNTTGFESHVRDLGNHLQFDDSGTGGFQAPDLAGQGTEDLALPAGGNPDLSTPVMTGGMDGGSTMPPTCGTVENCFNDLDDDCNGKVNDGCPDTVTLGTQVPLGPYGASSGGTAGSALCPAGTAMIGADFFTDGYDEYMSGVGVYCGTPTLTRGATSYSLTFAPVSGLGPSFQGSATDSDEVDNCASASQAGWVFYADNNNRYVDGLAFDCGKSKLTLDAGNHLSITLSAAGNPTGPNYGFYTIHSVDCDAGSVLVGYTGLTNGVMTQAEGVCAPLVVNYKM